VGEYRRLYRRGAYLPADYRTMLHRRAAPLITKYRLAPDRRSFRETPQPKQRPEPATVGAGQATLF